MNTYRSPFTLRRLVFAPALRVAALLLALSANAFAAEPVPNSDPDGKLTAVEGAPWMTNVTPDRKQRAQALFDEGNRQFAFPDFAGAAQKFREALDAWKHPAIHYNLALSLRAVEQYAAAYEHLEQALAYGGSGLSEARRRDAEGFLKELGAKISILQISCREPGTTVILDGSTVQKLPSRQLLMPGAHQVIARKPGYEQSEYPLALSAGKPSKLETRLYTLEEQVEVKYRVPRWIPWGVMGTGAALGITGAVLLNQSNSLLEQVDSEFSARPDCGSGCTLTAEWRDMQHDSDTYKTWATVSFVTGAIAVAGGAVWLPLNKTTRRRSPEELDHQTTVTPIVTSNLLGASAMGRF